MSPESTILDAIMNYGIETIGIAVIINIITALIKKPIKAWANKRADGGAEIKKYITLIPIALGFLLTTGHTYIFLHGTIFNQDFMVLWLTSSSLSLSLYAIFEKFFPTDGIISFGALIDINGGTVPVIADLN